MSELRLSTNCLGFALLRNALLVRGKEPSNKSLQLTPKKVLETVDTILVNQQGAADAAGQLNFMPGGKNRGVLRVMYTAWRCG